MIGPTSPEVDVEKTVLANSCPTPIARICFFFSCQISNFDERLHPLLKNLGVHDLFDFVLTSRECGSEKPAPFMFSEAARHSGAPNNKGTSGGVHIGDNFSKDIVGASGVGWVPVLITERNPTREEVTVEHIRVRDLAAVPGALGIESRNKRR